MNTKKSEHTPCLSEIVSNSGQSEITRDFISTRIRFSLLEMVLATSSGWFLTMMGESTLMHRVTLLGPIVIDRNFCNPHRFISESSFSDSLPIEIDSSSENRGNAISTKSFKTLSHTTSRFIITLENTDASSLITRTSGSAKHPSIHTPVVTLPSLPN